VNKIFVTRAMVQADTIADFNRRFSVEEYDKLKALQKDSFKNDLKKVLVNLKNIYQVQMLDDEYLFSVVSTKANYSHMQLVNEYRDLIFKQKNTKDDAKQSSEINSQKETIRIKLLESIFGSYSLFNRVDEKTIAINQEILKKMIA
jgi:hypothetical protein